MVARCIQRTAQILAWRGWLLAKMGRYEEAPELVATVPEAEFAGQAAIIGRRLRVRLEAEPPLIAEAPVLGLSPALSAMRTDLPSPEETGRPLNVQAGSVWPQKGSTWPVKARLS